MTSADAQTSGRSLASVERERAAARAEAERLEQAAQNAAREAALLNARLDEAGKRRSKTDEAAMAADAQFAQLSAAASWQARDSERARQNLETALAAHVLSAKRRETAAQRARLVLAAAIPALDRDFAETSAALARTQSLARNAAEERQLLAAAQTAIDAERAGLVELADARLHDQARLSADASEAQARAQRLAREASTLRELVERASRTRSRSAQGGGVIPASWQAPTAGRIVQAFGATGASQHSSHGVALRASPGAQIAAPQNADVAYADVFRSYGRVLILNVDGGYAVVLAGLETIQVRPGDHVRAGQIVGVMPQSTIPAPDLYVEVRRNGAPVNPGPWLAARGLTASNGAANPG